MVILWCLALLAPAACNSDGEPHVPGSTADRPTDFGPPLAPNPFLGPAGTATMHGDSGSSDTTPLPGPGTGPVEIESIELGAVCPAVLVGRDEYPVALCTRIVDLRPVVHLLDPGSGSPLASIELTPGSLFGGVYGYLDEADRMVLVDGASDLLRIGHRRAGDGWSVEVEERLSLAGSLDLGDTVTSVSPGYDGAVWFATGGGTVGVADTASGSVRTVALPAGERVSNSISTAPAGAAVATDQAVYLIASGPDGRPEVRWRVGYDRGPARKPGQLSWGTGSTPTFFGPTDGADFVAVVDNADPEVHLVVIRASGRDAGQEVCAPVVLGEGGPGSENSPIGAGRSVIVASTYGYVYPRLPEDAGPSSPEAAAFNGGMTRVDIRPDGSGCDIVWENDVRSVAVPKLSMPDGTIVTMTAPVSGAAAGGQGAYSYAVVGAGAGELLTEQELGEEVGDPLQLAGTTASDGVLYQGTVGAILRITASNRPLRRSLRPTLGPDRPGGT